MRMADPAKEHFDEQEFWRKEGEEFWCQIVPPEEDRALFTTRPWRGEFRWFRSPNIVCIEKYRRACAKNC
jgi:hypothetical protein